MKKTTIKKSTLVLIIIVAVVSLISVSQVVILYHTFFTAECRWSSSLVEAIKDGETEEALALIDEGVEKGYEMDTPTFNTTVFTTLSEMSPDKPLRIACHEGNLSVVESLLKNGAKATPESDSEWGYIYCVVVRAYSETDIPVIRLLIEHGASADYSSISGYPILEAAQRPHSFAYNDESMSREQIARGVTEVFRYLAESTDCRVTDSAERNALHYAVIHQQWHLAEVLVNEYGFDVSARDKWGNTAYDLALERGGPDHILELLRGTHNET